MTHSARVALYCRVSVDGMEKDPKTGKMVPRQTTERQVRDLTAFAARRGDEVVAVIEEKASGAKSDRPQRQRVLEMAQARLIDAVLVSELSRWGRSTEDLLRTIKQLYAHNVVLIAEKGANFNMGTKEGELFLTIIAALSQFERQLIAERIRSGLDTARAKGVKLGRQLGQRPSDKKAKRVLAHRAEGMSIRAIARHAQMSTATVQQILKREAST
jgi:putative DNA-invertase from lambdoid prophage Rac